MKKWAHRWSLSVAAAACVASFVSPASAHGGFPRAHQILFDPTNDQRILVQSDFWGIFVSDDRGETWRLICSAAYGGRPQQLTRAPMAMAADGTLFVAASFRGLMKASADLCDFTQVPELFRVQDGGMVAELVSSVVAYEGGESLLALVASGYGGVIHSAVWRSADRGGTWSKVGTDFDPAFSASGVAVAPSDSMRIYVAGAVINGGGHLLFRSIDGGTSWESFPVTVTQEFPTLRIAAVHPANPDTVFLWVDSGGGDIPEAAPDAILVSSDGGESWSTLYTGQKDIPGFELSADGSTIFLSGYAEGIHSAPLADAIAQGQAAFTQFATGRTFGLTWTADGLYAGLDDWGDARAMLAVSTDDATSFATVTTLCTVVDSGCAPDSTVGAACPMAMADLSVDYVTGRCTAQLDGGQAGSGTGGEPGTGTGGAAGDSGVIPPGVIQPSPGEEDSGGCSCSTVAPVKAGGGGAALGIGLLALIRRRARGTRRSVRS